MGRTLWLFVVLTAAASCGGNSPDAPTLPPAPTSLTMTGQVTSTNGPPIRGADVTFLDGLNAGKHAITDAQGQYSIGALQQGGFTVSVLAPGYVSTSRSVTLTSNNLVLAVQLAPLPLFSMSGTGAASFDVPPFVSRLRITGRNTGPSVNFIVRIAGLVVVNDQIGIGAPSTLSDGTYTTAGGVAEVINSSGVSWTFAEPAGR